MRLNLLLFAMVIANAITAQNFYDLNTIQTIEITFAESNWDALLDAEKAGDENYILAQSVTINGEVFDSVGVKYKGNSTYQANQTKNPFHIELDTYKDHKYEAYTDIKLSNVAKDPSFLREVLSYEILRQYMDAPLSNYANVYVNGELIGLYSNSESISKKFVNSRFGSKSNAFIKCNPPDGAGPQSNDLPNLVYLGQDSSSYYDAYELKSDYGWQELIDLCDTLKNHTEEIEKILDVDRALWMLAFNNVLVNLDSYTGGFSQNYYLYRDEYQRFLPVVWDLNESFGQFSMTGSGNLNNTASKQQMSHLLHINDSDFPLIQQLLNIPTYKKMYLAHVKTMLLENFDNGSYAEKGQTLQTLISADVQADNNKFFTYNNFISNLTSDVNSGGPGGPGGGSSTPGIINLMDGRNSYLLGLSDFTKTEPVISNILTSNSNPDVNETISISASVTNANNVILAYRNMSGAPFIKLELLDDENHIGGIANDGIYGVNLKITGSTTEYYIYAENNDIGKFSPQRAQHEFYTLNANAVVGDLVINEFMASNDTTQADQDGEFDDWIELYNNGDASIDLAGYTLSDDGSDLALFTFPDGTVIGSGEYLIVWTDDDIDQDGFHAAFKLSASGETIYLADAAGTIVDEIDFPEQETDASYSRIPNGTGDFVITNSTFNKNNDGDLDCLNNGGDADEDGICADVDCDDNDAEVGAQQAPGTSCDDNDPATVNDVIQTDGCSCEGTILMPSEVVINEFMASNEITQADQDGEFDDWIELYNNGDVSIDISGYTLSDDGSDLALFTFPDGTVIGSDEYLIVWADDDIDQAGFHAAFKLSAGGETIYLTDVAGNIVNEIIFPEQTTDASYSRIPNGTGDFVITNPTFNGNNDEVMDCTNNGGDADGDGICADVDCDDNDAEVGAQQAPGTSCDDNDPATTNDVIQADGCSCEGTILMPSEVVINEFMASNETSQADQDGEFDDWIELYNNGDASIDLSGYTLSDDGSDLALFTFPDGTVIGSDEYLIVWADDDIDQAGFHAAFKLSAGGETIYLTDAAGNIVNEIIFPEQTTDASYSRIPNGTGDFVITNPSFNRNNDEAMDCANNGGDADGDGICADEDCDDNDAEVGAQQTPGASCDDNDPTTINDVVQDDGCTCEGEVLMLSDLVINEFMASNETTQADQDGEFDDWIELYNNGDASIDLSGYTLSDDDSDLALFTFPDGTVIGSDEYLIVWADDDIDQSGFHAAFKISAGGETLYLVDDEGKIVDLVTFPEQETDISYGRFPNGTGDFQPMSPTYNKFNSDLTSAQDFEIENAVITVYPNPAQDQINIKASEVLSKITLYSLTGQNVLEKLVDSDNTYISTSTLINGIYVLQAVTINQNVVSQKVVIQH